MQVRAQQRGFRKNAYLQKLVAADMDKAPSSIYCGNGVLSVQKEDFATNMALAGQVAELATAIQALEDSAAAPLIPEQLVEMRHSLEHVQTLLAEMDTNGADTGAWV